MFSSYNKMCDNKHHIAKCKKSLVNKIPRDRLGTVVAL